MKKMSEAEKRMSQPYVPHTEKQIVLATANYAITKYLDLEYHVTSDGEDYTNYFSVSLNSDKQLKIIKQNQPLPAELAGKALTVDFGLDESGHTVVKATLVVPLESNT